MSCQVKALEPTTRAPRLSKGPRPLCHFISRLSCCNNENKNGVMEAIFSGGLWSDFGHFTKMVKTQYIAS